jgi:outer membrane murein-binding lipoprotein Lpp
LGENDKDSAPWRKRARRVELIVRDAMTAATQSPYRSEGNVMNKITLAAAAVATLALAACDRGKQEELGNDVELNAVGATDDLNALSDQAAEVAAEAEALQNQAAELEQEGNMLDDATGAETPADENIQGM